MSTTTEKHKVEDAIGRYQQEVARSEERLTTAAIDTGVYLRHLLMPILDRWGMGMKKGGALLYPEPNVHRMADGIWEVAMGKECDYALGALHPELADALWSVVDIFPYEDTFHDYVDDIPLPTNRNDYVWVTIDNETVVLINFTDSITSPPMESDVYYGPVTKAYMQDIANHGDVTEFIVTLPRYIVNEDNQWELQNPEVTGIPQ